ncbi:uncharacterized protein LOC115449061 [Manduca sexta]|uniref:uncharacterized protein LOC115449061 n=1 Tax=Manduca sexta TaxID=7130 RepID=UPI00118340DB|nr:uncharacterized protein LOC115449061 [Manduca sexta]
MSKREEAQMSQIDLNVLIKFVGTFDGSREKLSPFLNNCRNAINLASASQTDTLLKYILSRLEGKAETACDVKEFTSWSQLEDFLKTQFGESKHYAYLLSDLQECRQGRNETVSHYSLRVEACLAKLLTEINISIPTRKKDELAGRVAAMQDLALNVFIIGLQPGLSTVVRCRDPGSLNEAINFATAEEKILGISRKYQGPSTSQYSPDQRKPNYTQNNTSSFSRPRPQNQPPFRPNSSAPICRYCKNIGHTIENCRKREYNNQNRRFNQNRAPQNAVHAVTSPDAEGVDLVNHDLNDSSFPFRIVREE